VYSSSQYCLENDVSVPEEKEEFLVYLDLCSYVTCLNCVFFRSVLLTKPKSEMTPEELAKREDEEFSTGPLSVLTQSVKNNTQVVGI
jgi:hypothetical protein